ncbi:SapC family protein [Sphingomonas sp. HITSZ_GF]|uniref:SapC family protein n=1 Tax=Sphingomonas sp. HITSZ_GF TaxID=3037247 RepID=UPI00240DD8A0|nr:SapC family protein [Sphingomonas sp. HITSZ_GF]MDG2535159.1 SapC family protein [Sphingomonas sp. HITSZ_GF]
MTRPVALDNVAHADLRVALRHGAAYGDAVNQALLFPTEFAEAQRDFPILFRRDPAEGLQAIALLGLDRDENLFLDGDRWTSRHVPLSLQRGPFLIGLNPDGSAPVIQIDLDDPRVDAADGEPLFLPHGGQGRYLDHVGKILAAIHVGMSDAPPMYAAFDALGLIQPMALELLLDDERRYVIRDHEVLSAEKLAALGPDALDQLNRAGHLGTAFLLAASLGNMARLIERKNRAG